MLQTATLEKHDIMIICEETKTLRFWYSGIHGKATITIHQAINPEEIGYSWKEYVWVRMSKIRTYSCYVSPNIAISDYREYLEGLEASIRIGSWEVILVGDFNAKNAEWGSTVNDQRGDEIASLDFSLSLNVCNTGSTPTFERGSSHSIFDWTISSPFSER